MSTWVSAAPVIGTGSLDGFAIGALMCGACALAITAPRRAGRLSAARGGAQAAARDGWLCEHVMAAEAIESGAAAELLGAEAGAAAIDVVTDGARAGLAAGASGAGAERLARPEELGAQGKGRRSAGGRAAKAAGGYQSRHRRGDPIPGSVRRDGASQRGAFPDSAFPGSASRRSAFPDSAFPGGWSRRDAHPDVVFPDAEVSAPTLGSPARPEVRRLPRHAAPSVGMSSRISGFGRRMTGLFATRQLATGARG